MFQLSIKDFFFGVLIFCFIFGFKIFGVDALDLSFAASVYIIGINLLKKGIPSDSTLNATMQFFAAAALGVSALLVLNGSSDYFLPLRILKASTLFWAAYYFSSARPAASFVLPCLSFCFFIHALIMLGEYLLPNVFRENVYHLTGAYDIVHQNFPFTRGIRVSGLTYGLSQTSLLHAFGAYLAIVLLLIERSKMMRYVLHATLNLVAVFISGRSGIFILPFIAVLFLFTTETPRKLLRKGSLALLFFLATTTACLAFISLRSERVFIHLHTRIFEVLEILLYGTSRTASHLATMYSFPESINDLITGRSYSSISILGRLPSDLGFIKIIDSVGILGLLLHLLVYLFILKKWFDQRNNIAALNILFFSIFTFHLLFNFKEMAFFVRNQFSFIAILFWITLNFKSDRLRSATIDA